MITQFGGVPSYRKDPDWIAAQSRLIDLVPAAFDYSDPQRMWDEVNLDLRRRQGARPMACFEMQEIEVRHAAGR